MVYVKKEDWISYSAEELPTTIKGAINELLACTWLLEQGYEVFRNVCPTGKGDIIAWKKGEAPIIIDVKVSGKSKSHEVRTLLHKNGNFEWAD